MQQQEVRLTRAAASEYLKGIDKSLECICYMITIKLRPPIASPDLIRKCEIHNDILCFVSIITFRIHFNDGNFLNIKGIVA